LFRSSASLCPAPLQLLPQAIGLDQHILRISKLLLPLVAEPAKVGPVALLTLREPLDQFKVNLGAVLLHHHAEGLPRLLPQAERFELLQLAEDLFKALVKLVEDFVELQFSGGALAMPLLRPGVRGFRWFWHGTCWAPVGRPLQIG
jgi:hypothetical protein